MRPAYAVYLCCGVTQILPKCNTIAAATKQPVRVHPETYTESMVLRKKKYWRDKVHGQHYSQPAFD